ncbi:anillin isoform X2 [Anastrepha obliqua]|uniref:anillin isoform X2 n=1 Tax=Anastrepha obliqua TaxID=95512 RepID=UPI002409EE29|nr:anillin isoform X2 [Anastrepha obliqua]
MDPFTQRMLDKAEQRSRALGISSAGVYSRYESTGATEDGQTCQQLTVQQKPSIIQQLDRQVTPAASAQALTQTVVNRSVESSTSSGNKLQVVEKTPIDVMKPSSSTKKVHRQFSAVDKENRDMGIEINIVTDKNVEVQVQVEEEEIVDDDCKQHRLKSVSEQPMAKIRDTSRSRLQRLGALYANPNDLSSPIHRTEGQFCADSPTEGVFENSVKPVKQRYGKLAELACSINQWEDDISHHDPRPVSAVPPPKPDLPSRKISDVRPSKPALSSRNTAGEALTKTKVLTQLAPVSSERTDNQSTDVSEQIKTKRIFTTTKQLTWDPNVINSLEAQGFQRRESTTVKLAYEYPKLDEKEPMEELDNELKVDENIPKVVKLANTFSKAIEEKKNVANPQDVKSINVKPGLVSGRAAAFENKSSGGQQLNRPQKDPTELSLKERMQLFERNKGEALVPKAALGMAPCISKIRQDEAALRREVGAKASAALACNHTNSSLLLPPKPSSENKLRGKVAALTATTVTMAESKIKAEIQKQRQEDMQVLAKRFNKQKEVFEKNEEQSVQSETLQMQSCVVPSTKHTITSAPRQLHTPPPPPPMPKIILDVNKKRHSPSDIIDDDESKRSRKSVTITAGSSKAASLQNQMYPALSDLESDSDRENGCTTATMSGHSATEEHTRILAATAETGHADSNIDDESYMDSEEADDSSIDICNGSLGRVIMQVVQKNDHQQQQCQQPKQVKEVRYADKNEFYGCNDSSINSSEASGGVDDFLDEAFDDYGDDDCTEESVDDMPRESKGTTASNSFTFRKTPKKYTNYQTISEENIESASSSKTAACTSQPVKSELSINRGNDDNMVTLVHTVSFYRRQQSDNSASSTPVRKVSREQQELRSDIISATGAAMQINYPKQQETTEQNIKHDETYVVEECGEEDDNSSEQTESDDSHLVEEKIKKLLDEVCKQQTIISQTSQALNLCAATIEFSGSTESVEGERHLLVATHRRQACLDEVQRLRVEKCLRPLGALRDRGRLTVKEITIPLRQDYIRKLAADTISGHHLVCLLKYNEYVLATKTVPTLPGLLAVKFPDVLQMNNVYADFRITLEIYGMTAQREVLPHEVKYHINLNKKSGIKTPKKKGSENRLVMPPVQSPAGPNAVRTPALVQYGFAIFSLREIQRTSWTLTQVLGVSPLEGLVHMKVNCELSFLVEHRGFLTMFEEISGFGAWHRRWCYLNGSVLNYWKYPDDERKKAPIGSIDLYACRTQKVTVAPRDICARLNTMLLEFVRPAKETDVESLIIVPNGRNTVVRYLLSADTKEERELWCAYLNKVLLLLRSWGPPQ